MPSNQGFGKFGTGSGAMRANDPLLERPTPGSFCDSTVVFLARHWRVACRLLREHCTVLQPIQAA
eukprot:2935145-Amphidinium_carterae.1